MSDTLILVLVAAITVIGGLLIYFRKSKKKESWPIKPNPIKTDGPEEEDPIKLDDVKPPKDPTPIDPI